MIELPEKIDFSRAAAISVLKAVATKDRDLLEKVAAGFDAAAVRLLQEWVHEAITGKWLIFSEGESYGLTRDLNFPRRMLLWVFADVRPRLLIKTMVTW